jgi:NDP-sugar pyrophosphorylase family protein
MHIAFAHEESLIGSGGTLAFCRRILPPDMTLVVYGDTVTNADLSSALRRHVEDGAGVTLMTANGSGKGGYASCGHGGVVSDFREVDESPGNGWLRFSGVAIVDHDVSVYGKDFAADVIPDIIRHGVLARAWEIDNETEYAIDIGTLDGYRMAQEACGVH